MQHRSDLEDLRIEAPSVRDEITMRADISPDSLESAEPGKPEELVLGIVSARLRNHDTARLVLGWLQQLKRHPIRRVAMCFPTVSDHWTRLIQQQVRLAL